MEAGKVKFFNERGWGFIIGDNGRDYYFIGRATSEILHSGDRVMFMTEVTRRGIRAIQIVKC